MLEEIHEFLGVWALPTMAASVVVGGAAPRYQRFSDFRSVRRRTLVRGGVAPFIESRAACV
jgi:hypothetical protein